MRATTVARSLLWSNVLAYPLLHAPDPNRWVWQLLAWWLPALAFEVAAWRDRVAARSKQPPGSA